MALPPRGTRWNLGLMGALIGVVLFLTAACGASGEGGPSRSDGRTNETKACPESQRPAATQKANTEHDPVGACVAQNQPQRPEPETTVRSTPNPQGPGPQSIAGMGAEAALTTLQKPGLECWQPVERGVLYACGSDEDEDLVYEARIIGSSTDEVSGVEARVFWQGTGDFEVASRPFFGLLSAQLRYRGANSKRAFEFVNRNLSSRQAAATIGAAKWTMTTSDDSKELTLTPAQ